MDLDKKALAELMKMSDTELCDVLKKLASEAGADAEALNIAPSDAAKIRTALRFASDDDIARLIERFGGGMK